jgi:MerR family copper efflux transcriptional regulator
MQTTFFIGELSRKTGVLNQTIRYYEQQGLLQPTERTEAGYRLYSDADVQRLRFIQQAKLFGLTLEEIKELMDVRAEGVAPCGHLRRMVGNHIDDINHRIQELVLFRDDLSRRYEEMNKAEVSGRICGIIESRDLARSEPEN